MVVPVLCPKTKEAFHKDEVYLDVVFMGSITEVTMTSFDPSDRRFIGRYQYCAWKELAS